MLSTLLKIRLKYLIDLIEFKKLQSWYYYKDIKAKIKEEI